MACLERKRSVVSFFFIPLSSIGAAAACAASPELDDAPLVLEAREVSAASSAPAIQSAYLGAVNQALIPFCPTQPAGAVLEGMPVVFNRQIYDLSLRADQFTVTNSLGVKVSPRCATLAPADEENEDNTVLLVGDFVPNDAVTISNVAVKGLYAEGPDGEGRGDAFGSLSFSSVTPVSESTRLIAAEVPADPDLGGCPASSPAAVQVVRATWIGGLRPLAGDRAALITVRDAAGASLPVAGISAAEENDADNILDVCLASGAAPAMISVQAGAYTAPNGLPNAATSIAID